MTPGGCALLAGLVTLCCASLASAADDAESARRHAPSPGYDGVYGRMDGSLAWSAALGAELEQGEPRAALRVAGHYLWVAGGYARYSDGFGSGSDRPLRVASLGVDVRPLFLPRFSQNWEQGPPRLDLLLDSISLTAGAYFAQPRAGSFGEEQGFELGVGFAVPLMAQAAGPWLEARAERRLAEDAPDAWLFTLALSLQGFCLSTDSPP